MLLPILKFPDKRLTQVSKEVTEINDEIKTLAKNMLETMYEAEGIGLAAPQIGQFIRMIVIDLSGPEERSDSMVLINPKLTKIDDAGEISGEEGCLSVPLNYRAKVKRSAKVIVEAVDLDNKPVKFEAEDLMSVCLQHEVDHLDGKLFIDHLSMLKRGMYTSRLANKAKKEKL